MWIWWIISLVVLIACFIFAYRVIVSSYEFLPDDGKNFLRFRRNNSSEESAKNDLIWEVRNKLQKMEENSTFYEIQFSKLTERLKALEQLNQQSQPLLQEKEDEEDWKEMYYEENELKEKLENELDAVKQKLEETTAKLNSLEENNSRWAGLQSDYDARLNDLQSMQNNIGNLQRQLEAATQREKELQQSLLQEVMIRKQNTELQNAQARLQSENDELRRQIVEMHQKEKNREADITRLHELESKLLLYEEEKAKMIADLEQMFNQNKLFSLPKNS